MSANDAPPTPTSDEEPRKQKSRNPATPTPTPTIDLRTRFLGSIGDVHQRNERYSRERDTRHAACTMSGGELAARGATSAVTDSHRTGLSLNNVSPSQIIRAQSHLL